MKIIYFMIGVLAMIVGSIGVILPILPTAPFLLIALYCFTRSSDRARNWFVNTKLYQRHLDDFVKTRSMTLKSKIYILGFASCMLMLAFFAMKNMYGRIAILVLIIFKFYYFSFRIQTIKKEGSSND